MKNILFIFFLLCNLIAYTKTFYVSSNNGNDNNNGSFDLPFKSIQKAINNLEAGDTLIVLEGIYYENLSFPKSGTDDLPILLKNFPNHRVVIKNVNTKKDWILHEKNIYKTKINNKILQVFFDDLPEMQASFPTILEGQLTKNSWLDAFANTNKTITLSQNFKMNPNENVQFCGIFGNGLIAIGGKVIEKNSNTITIENDSWYWGDSYKEDYLTSGKCFLTGSYQFLDSPGEWYCDSNYFYTIPKNNDTLNLSKLELREQFYVLNLKDQKNITIEGVHFFGGSLNLNNAERCIVSNCTIEYVRPFFNFTYGYTANMDTTKIGHGILVTGKNNSIINTMISNSWGDGLTVNGDNITIENCLINNCDWMGIDCAPIYISGSQNTIKNNTIKNSGRSLIVHGIKNSKIINNHLSNFGWLNSDLGGIYCYGVDGQNTEIAYNFVTKSKAKNGVGIYIDNGCKNYSVHHNIVNFCNVGITLNKPGTNYKIYNNTLYKNNFSMGSWGPGQYLINTQTFNNLTDNDNRLKWNYQAFYGTKLDSNYIYKSSIFEDPYNKNFTLKPFSYPIDKGIITEETKIFKGKSPDLGAIESDSDTIKYGSNLIEKNSKNSIPLPPINLICFQKNNTVKMEWKYPYDFVKEFVVFRKESNSKYKEIGRSKNLGFVDSLQNIGEYRYYIIATNENGSSDESNSVEIFYDKFENKQFLNAENCDLEKGINVENDMITNTDNKDWICFKQIELNNFNRCKTRYAVPCEYAGQEVQIRLDKYNGKIIGKLNTLSTKSFDSLNIHEYEIDTVKGTHDIYIRYRGSYGVGNFDWFELYNSKDSIKNQYDIDCSKPNGMQDFYSSIVFPNPSNKDITVSYYSKSTTKIEIKIYDQYGLNLINYNSTDLAPGTSELEILEFSNLKNGVYILNTTIYYKDKVIENKNHKILKI